MSPLLLILLESACAINVAVLEILVEKIERLPKESNAIVMGGLALFFVLCTNVLWFLRFYKPGTPTMYSYCIGAVHLVYCVVSIICCSLEILKICGLNLRHFGSVPLIVAIVIAVLIFLELLLEFIIPRLFPGFLPWHHPPAAAATTGASQNSVHGDEGHEAEHASENNLEIELTTSEDNGRQETEPVSDERAAPASDERPASASNERPASASETTPDEGLPASASETTPDEGLSASASETTGNPPDEGSSPSKAEEGVQFQSLPVAAAAAYPPHSLPSIHPMFAFPQPQLTAAGRSPHIGLQRPLFNATNRPSPLATGGRLQYWLARPPLHIDEGPSFRTENPLLSIPRPRFTAAGVLHQSGGPSLPSVRSVLNFPQQRSTAAEPPASPAHNFGSDALHYPLPQSQALIPALMEVHHLVLLIEGSGLSTLIELSLLMEAHQEHPRIE